MYNKNIIVWQLRKMTLWNSGLLTVICVYECHSEQNTWICAAVMAAFQVQVRSQETFLVIFLSPPRANQLRDQLGHRLQDQERSFSGKG